MFLTQKKLILVFISILIFLIGFENYKGLLSNYIFVYESIAHKSIFSQNDWTFLVQDGLRHLPIRVLDFVNIKITNDFYLFSIYFFGGLISIYFLNKILLEIFVVKDFYSRFTILFCIAFANFIIFKSIWSSSFIPFFNIQTSLATQLIYPFFYMVLSQKFVSASIISSILIFVHFTVAWLPTLIYSVYLIAKTKFKNIKILYLLIPLTTFSLMYYLNLDVNSEVTQDKVGLIELILNRALEEAVVALQPTSRIIYFCVSIFIFYNIQKKVIKDKNIDLFFSITFYITIFSIFFGFVWTSFGYKYLPFVSLSYLYFSRAILSYHILFLLLITYFFYLQNFSPVRKVTIFIIIYTLGKTYLSLKGIIIAIVFFIISMFLEKIFKKRSIELIKSSKSILLVLLIYIFISQIYFIKKNNLNFIDEWSIKNLNDWTQHNQFFLQKDNKYKDEIFSLRHCDDFILIPIISFNDDLRYENYLNIVSHKSLYSVSSSIFFENHTHYLINNEKTEKINSFIKDLKNKKDLEFILNSKSFKDTAFLFDKIIYKKYFLDLDNQFNHNFIKLTDELIFYSNNSKIKKKIENCTIN